MRTASMMSSDEIAQETIKQLRADNDALRNSHAAIYLALGNNEADHTKWPAQIVALRATLEWYEQSALLAASSLKNWAEHGPAFKEQALEDYAALESRAALAQGGAK